MTHMNFFMSHGLNNVAYIRITLETGCVQHERWDHGRCYEEACDEYMHPIPELPKFIETIQKEGFRFFVPEPKLIL